MLPGRRLPNSTEYGGPPGFFWESHSKTSKVPSKSQPSHSFDSWMVSLPDQTCVQIWITSHSQKPYLKGDSWSLIFGLRGELKGVYVSEIIRVRHLRTQILCQPINIYECVKFPSAPFHNFHALQVGRCLTLEIIALHASSFLTLWSSLFKILTHLYEATYAHLPCWNQAEWGLLT